MPMCRPVKLVVKSDFLRGEPQVSMHFKVLWICLPFKGDSHRSEMPGPRCEPWRGQARVDLPAPSPVSCVRFGVN